MTKNLGCNRNETKNVGKQQKNSLKRGKLKRKTCPNGYGIFKS